MNFSAAASSSSVVVPGRAFAANIFRQRTRTSPDAAIFSTCSGVFLMIIRYTLVIGHGQTRNEDRLDGLVLLHPQGRQGPADLLRDRFGRRLTGDPAQDAAAVVVADQRLGLLVVGLEPLADHLGLVVVADDQRGSVDIAEAFLLRRFELDV